MLDVENYHKDCYDHELQHTLHFISVAYLLHLEIDHEAHRKEQPKQQEEPSQGACGVLPSKFQLLLKLLREASSQEGYREESSWEEATTLKPTAVTPVAKADPADKVDVGTLLQDPAVNKLLTMLTNQPGLFTQVANSAAAVADTSAASNNDDSVSETASWKSSPPLPRRSPRQLELELPSRSNKKASLPE
ncbi:hypothetical protein SEMRO_2071_G313420.1 [Seminavis robusta]|uniref:Uncharacterized protein n=1 Tax=Seminavis robusta TaxID=568900 RepID=A0A9N8HVW6_9STRA|nr:hypothetical protein SEMRO_2071_G313420.1 [Seminavis robusta]|eukprot:Sro2071_g313420.1 n/a (191) ;mRNA; f:17356-18039